MEEVSARQCRAEYRPLGVQILDRYRKLFNLFCFPLHQILFTCSQMCARGFGGADSCTGDSGGPLMARKGTAWHIEGGILNYDDDGDDK